jgi:hypothetical protein
MILSLLAKGIGQGRTGEIVRNKESFLPSPCHTPNKIVSVPGESTLIILPKPRLLLSFQVRRGCLRMSLVSIYVDGYQIVNVVNPSPHHAWLGVALFFFVVPWTYPYLLYIIRSTQMYSQLRYMHSQYVQLRNDTSIWLLLNGGARIYDMMSIKNSVKTSCESLDWIRL